MLLDTFFDISCYILMCLYYFVVFVDMFLGCSGRNVNDQMGIKEKVNLFGTGPPTGVVCIFNSWVRALKFKVGFRSVRPRKDVMIRSRRASDAFRA